MKRKLKAGRTTLAFLQNVRSQAESSSMFSFDGEFSYEAWLAAYRLLNAAIDAHIKEYTKAEFEDKFSRKMLRIK